MNMIGINFKQLTLSRIKLLIFGENGFIHFVWNLIIYSVWNHTQLGRFDWSWFDVTSFEPYREETSYENSLLVQHTGALALSSLVHVFRSLTPNARGIFILIAEHQLEEKDNTSYIGKLANC